MARPARRGQGGGEGQEELREAAKQIAAGEGVGMEHMVLANDRPVAIVAQQIMTWLGWV